MRVASHPQHNLLGDGLNRRRDIHLALRDFGLGRARRTVKQLFHLSGGHPIRVAKREVIHVHAERTVLLGVKELIQDAVPIDRLAVGREAHELVLATIHPKAGEIGEG